MHLSGSSQIHKLLSLCETCAYRWVHGGSPAPCGLSEKRRPGPFGQTTLRLRTPTLSSNQQGRAANTSGIQAKKLVRLLTC